MDPNLVQAIAAAVGAVIAAGGLLWKFGGAISRIVHMFDDMAGAPARKGVAARPGLMERMASMEALAGQLQVTQNAHTEQLNSLTDETAEQSRVLNSVSHEVHYNNGSSVKDSTTRTEAALKVVAGDVADIKRRLGDLPAADNER